MGVKITLHMTMIVAEFRTIDVYRTAIFPGLGTLVPLEGLASIPKRSHCLCTDSSALACGVLHAKDQHIGAYNASYPKKDVFSLRLARWLGRLLIQYVPGTLFLHSASYSVPAAIVL